MNIKINCGIAYIIILFTQVIVIPNVAQLSACQHLNLSMADKKFSFQILFLFFSKKTGFLNFMQTVSLPLDLNKNNCMKYQKLIRWQKSADDKHIWFLFLFFRQQDLTIHANCL